jgi:AraC family transcriptional regulator
MEPQFLAKPAFQVVGIPLNGKDRVSEIDALWDQLAACYAEIPHADPDQGYGVHRLHADRREYLAGLAVRKAGTIPAGMAAQQIPANVYAVFLHRGLATDLMQTIEEILRVWLPESGYHWAGDYFFEYYDDRFQPGSRDSVIFIYLPIREE